MDQYIVTGMSCAACQARVEKAVSGVPGVESCSVSLLTNTLGVEGSADPSAVIKAVLDAGYGASSKRASSEGRAEGQAEGQGFSGYEAEEEALRDRETPKLVKRLVWSAGFLLLLMYISMGHGMLHLPLPFFMAGNYAALGTAEMLLAIIVMTINRKFFTSGFKALVELAPNMDSLVALGSSAAFVFSLASLFSIFNEMNLGNQMRVMDLGMNLYFETAAMIPALITVGKTLESLSKGRTTDALKSLMKLAPRTANVIRDGRETEVNAAEVVVGDIFLVRPGESIPVDGIVEEGESAVNESALTGESLPVDKCPGAPVFAASINESGFIRARAVSVGEDTTLSQIIRMVSDAAATKAPIARIADKAASVFVPVVIALSLITMTIWLLIGQSFTFAITRAVAVLVISCPCALGLATPAAIMVGSGMGAKKGILFKTAASLEEAGRIAVIALDKTGTITSGQPKVTDILPADGVSQEELLQLAVDLEQKSEHPLAGAVMAYAEERKLTAREVTGFRALPGHGLEASRGSDRIYGGSEGFMTGKFPASEKIRRQAEALAAEGKTPLFFAEDGRIIGLIAVMDTIKEDSAAAISELRKMGIEVVMITGDNERTARVIAAQAGVEHVVSGVLPEGKEKVIRELKKRGKAAMVGDGINDAPALARADLGIAIGAGADVALDAADIVVMKSHLSDVSAAIRLSRLVSRIIHQNLFWAFFYNVICIPLAAGFYSALFSWNFEMNPMVGAAAMSLSSFTVCMNALRLNLYDIYDASKDKKIRFKTPEKNLTEIITEADDQTQENKKENTDMTKTIMIEGMMCGHCESSVKKALEALEGVSSASVSHEDGRAVVELAAEVSDEVLKKAVEDKDFLVKSID